MWDSLLTSLRGHDAADAREAADVARVIALLEESAAPTSRHQFDPGHLTASGVVIDADRRQTLLVHHTKLRRWLQPGGHLEPGEVDPAEAARREVLEETGLLTRWPEDRPFLLDVDVHRIPARGSEPAHEHFDLRYLLVADEGRPWPGDGTEALRWALPREAEALDLDPGLRRALAKVSWSA